MGKKIKNYVATMMKLANEMAVEKGSSKQNKDEVLREMLVQIGFFQHERLLHLIVTVLFAFLTIFTMTAACFLDNCYYGMLFCLLSVVCMILLVPYIHHYYVLENSVQKLYEIYDAIRDVRKVDSDKRSKKLPHQS